jgi:Predicted permease.
MGQGFKPTIAYLNASGPEAVKSKIAEYDFVSSVKLKEEVVSAIETQLETVKSMVFVLALAAGILAFVVLYNLGIINYYERLRELATLMVLGFYNKEIKALVLRENTIFAITGIILGIPLGILLNNVLLGSSESAGYEINAYIGTVTFFIAAGLTFLYSWFVNLTLGRKFKEIDMVGALKSIE